MQLDDLTTYIHNLIAYMLFTDGTPLFFAE